MRKILGIILMLASCGMAGCLSSPTREEKQEGIDATRAVADAHQAAASDMAMRGDSDPQRREAWENSAGRYYEQAAKAEADLDSDHEDTPGWPSRFIDWFVDLIAINAFPDDDEEK
jgi:hypothetical protein